MYKFSKIYILALLLLLAACHKDIKQAPVRPENYGSQNFSQVFEAFWNGLNVNYPIWDVDSTNWDDVYRKYQPLFAKLDINKGADNIKANGYFKEMMAHMQEGHLWLTRVYQGDTGMESILLAPVTDRQQYRSDYHDSIPEEHFMQTVPSKYLLPGYVTGTEYTPGDTTAPLIQVVSGQLKEKPVLYLHISSFALEDLYTQPGTNTVKVALQHYFNQLLHLPANVKGLIIDVRGNGGGSTADLNFIVGRLVSERYVYGANRLKNGNGRLDYSPWMPAYVIPPAGSKTFSKPVMVLCDIFTGSMAEATTMAVKALPDGNGKAVGERTFGRTAAIAENMDMNAGKFSFENNNSQMSIGSSAFRYKDGSRYEGIGIPPDVPAPYDKAAIQAGRDPQLEKALSLIP